MSDLISRRAAYVTLAECYHLKTDLQHYALAEALERVPSADVQPVRHGHWIIPRFGADAKCSVCGYYFNDAYDMENEDNYCRHCGAKMDEVT